MSPFAGSLQDLVQGVSPTLMGKQCPCLYVLHIDQDGMQVSVYETKLQVSEKKVLSFPLSDLTSWHTFQKEELSQQDPLHFELILCRTGWENRLQPVFLPIQTPFLDHVLEFRDLCIETLAWNDHLCHTLSFSTQKAIVGEIWTVTTHYTSDASSSEEKLAHLLLQMNLWKEWFSAKRKEVKDKKMKLLKDLHQDEDQDLDQDQDQDSEFTSKFKRLHERKWSQLPETFRQSLVESQLYKENQLGGLQKSPVQVQLLDSSQKKTEKGRRKRKFSIQDTCPPLSYIPQEQEQKLYSKLVNKHIDWLKDQIRQTTILKKYKLPYKKEFSLFTLVVQKPRNGKTYSMFYWQKEAWLRLSEEQQKVIQERLEECIIT